MIDPSRRSDILSGRGPLTKRVVTGRVLRPDGKPAPEAFVSLYNGDKYVRMVKADERGRFELDIYGDFDYRVSADGAGAQTERSERVKIPKTANPAPVVLKLKGSDE